MVSSKLAELYVELSARGGGDINKAMDDLRNKMASTAKFAGQMGADTGNLFALKMKSAMTDARAALDFSQKAGEFMKSDLGQKSMHRVMGLESSTYLANQ